MLTPCPTPLQAQLAAWLEATLLCDWPEPERCTRCGREHEVEDCPVPSTYKLPADMDAVTTGSTTVFEDLADWPEARKQ